MPRKPLTGDMKMKGVLKSRDCTIKKTINVDITRETKNFYIVDTGIMEMKISKHDNKPAGVTKEAFPYWILELGNTNA